MNYLNQPDKAIVLCVDEKSEIQALDHTQPRLAKGPGYLEGVTLDYVRNGTTILFTALDIANCQVVTVCNKRHRHQEYLQFLKRVDANVPPDMAIHLVVDNYVTHKHPGVKRWLVGHPRYQVHYTPTYASWLNQVEIWFNIITQRAIRRGICKSVKDLIAEIEQFVAEYNINSHPFCWIATAVSILENVGKRPATDLDQLKQLDYFINNTTNKNSINDLITFHRNNKRDCILSYNRF
jgi:putative transposase